MYEIQHGVTPPPRKNSGGRPATYGFHRLTPGASMFIPTDEPPKVQAALGAWRARNKPTNVIRSRTANQGGVDGVFVWMEDDDEL